jgi:hypothetical protein
MEATTPMPHDWADDIIFPVIGGRPADSDAPWDIQAVLGTAFAVRDQVVTAWHCVRIAQEAGMDVGLAVQQPVEGKLKEKFVAVHFTRSVAGHDLAVGRIPWSPAPEPRLGGPPHDGMDVFTYGFPLSDTRQDPDSGLRIFTVGRRLLKGYVVRTTVLEIPGYPNAVGSELDMPAPGGLSGAPVFRTPSSSGTDLDLIGVVHSQISSADGTDFPVIFARIYGSAVIAQLLAEAS